MSRIRLSLEEHRLEIVCIALSILFIVLFLGLIVVTAARWPLPVDMEYGKRNSLRGAWSRNATTAMTHYRDNSNDTYGSRRTSFTDSIKGLKNGLARKIAGSLPIMGLISSNANAGDSLRRPSVGPPPSLMLRRKSSPGAAYFSRESRDLEEGSISTRVDDAASLTEWPRRRSGKRDAEGGGIPRAHFDESLVKPEKSLMD